jgi:hypothetical protein
MKIVKQSNSVMQNLCYVTLKELDDYLVITYPIGFSIEIKDKFVHIRKISDKPKAKPSEVENENCLCCKGICDCEYGCFHEHSKEYHHE